LRLKKTEKNSHQHIFINDTTKLDVGKRGKEDLFDFDIPFQRNSFDT